MPEILDEILASRRHDRHLKFDAPEPHRPSIRCYGLGMGKTEPQIASLSQRKLRNESGRVLRAVSAGRSFILTKSGVPIGRIVPLDAPAPVLAIARPPRREGGWAALAIERKATAQSLAVIHDDLRGDRL